MSFLSSAESLFEDYNIISDESYNDIDMSIDLAKCGYNLITIETLAHTVGTLATDKGVMHAVGKLLRDIIGLLLKILSRIVETIKLFFRAVINFFKKSSSDSQKIKEIERAESVIGKNLSSKDIRDALINLENKSSGEYEKTTNIGVVTSTASKLITSLELISICNEQKIPEKEIVDIYKDAESIVDDIAEEIERITKEQHDSETRIGTRMDKDTGNKLEVILHKINTIEGIFDSMDKSLIECKKQSGSHDDSSLKDILPKVAIMMRTARSNSINELNILKEKMTKNKVKFSVWNDLQNTVKALESSAHHYKESKHDDDLKRFAIGMRKLITSCSRLTNFEIRIAAVNIRAIEDSIDSKVHLAKLIDTVNRGHDVEIYHSHDGRGVTKLSNNSVYSDKVAIKGA